MWEGAMVDAGAQNRQLKVTAFDTPLGAVVEGWNPAADMTAALKAEIGRALAAHQVLVFRGHRPPTDDELVRFAQNFGDLVKGSEWFGDVDPIPEILRVNNLVGADGVPEGTGASRALEWHADYSYVPTVGKESFLEAVEIPRNNPPQTCFCSQYLALETLPAALVNALRGKRAYHSITGYANDDDGPQISENLASDDEFRKGFAAKRERNRKLGVSRPDIPQAIHPVILRHPDTGREILYVSKGITRHILGMPEDESKALLKELAQHSTRPDRVYAHDWQVGDMVMFDTLGTLHRRDAWEPGERRVMRQLSTWWTPPAGTAEAA
ncbi:MAG TPA: hypothetical protein DIT40_03345 [Alphaproteobacteria bacterium]|jgi:taurine dioxygenase/pentalenolactone F synthase|nr:hypothetical protein [Alphaproteobacteria bacterium]HCO89986.1 hypothetical protein [Alphaproteobacteria bacterium]